MTHSNHFRLEARTRSRLVSTLGLVSVSLLAACGGSSDGSSEKAPQGGKGGGVPAPKRPKPKGGEPSTSGETRNLESIVAKAEAATFESPVLLPESIVVEAAKRKAKKADRPLFVDYTGAWCGPCQNFNAAKKSGDKTLSAEAFKATFEQFDHLEIEEMLTTFNWTFGVPVEGVPTMYVYEPRNEAWSMASLGFDTLKSIANTLTSLLSTRDGAVPPGEPDSDTSTAAEPTLDQRIATFSELVDRLAAGGTVSESADEEWAALEVFFSSDLPFEKSIELLSKFAKLHTVNPKALETLSVSYLLGEVLNEPLASKKLTLEGLKASNPEFFQADKVAGNSWIRGYAFENPVNRLMSKSVSAADLVCEELLDFVRTSYLESQATSLDSRLKCALIGSFVGRIPQADMAKLLAEASALPDEEKPDDTQLMRLAAAAGDFERAQALVEKVLAESRESVAKRLADIEKQVEEKKAALAEVTDDAKKKELQEALEDLAFQKASQNSKLAEYVKVETRYRESFDRKVRSPMMLDPLFLEATAN